MAEKDGKIVRREVPTNIIYVDHLIRQRRLAEGSTESLYRPIFLRQYLLGGRMGGSRKTSDCWKSSSGMAPPLQVYGEVSPH